MFYSSPRVERLRDYHRLSTWEKKVLMDWIAAHVKGMALWSYTSLGIEELFEKSSLGFTLTHGQMQQAMLASGYEPLDENAEVWLFETGDNSQLNA